MLAGSYNVPLVLLLVVVAAGIALVAFALGSALLARRAAAHDAAVAAMNESLTTSLDRYRMLVESTHAVPWEMDGRTLALRYIAPQAERIFGHDIAGLVGSADFWALVDEQDRARVRAQFTALAASRDAKGIDLSFRVTLGSGGTAYVRSVVGAHVDDDGRGVSLRGITFDITEQRRLGMELHHAQKLESVGRLAAGVAHEINTPVQFVSDSLHFVRDGMQDLTRVIEAYRAAAATTNPEAMAAVRETLAEVDADADLDYLLENVPKAISRSLEGLDRVATIVRSMKEFAHPDQKDMAAVDLNRAVQSTLTVARNEYKYVADVDLDLGDIPAVTCHGGDVNQAVLNIIINAAHAIADRVRGTETKGRIGVRTRQDGDAVTISISDTGTGIPDSVRGRIFDPFFTTKGVGDGTGQGLAIARSVVVDKHGGTLTFETEPGAGTTFVIRLPIAGRPAAGVAA